jgi:hypothetical protein
VYDGVLLLLPLDPEPQLELRVGVEPEFEDLLRDGEEVLLGSYEPPDIVDEEFDDDPLDD